MYNPLVSVIIPNYCHSKYLDQRILSVLNQTYQNFEVIILDDASPDKGASKAVIEKYRDNPYVSHIVYNIQNSGSTFKQWDKGFNLAKGDLIWIAESDDIAKPELLITAVSNFDNNEKLVLSYCNSDYIDENGCYLWTPQNPPYDKTYQMNGKEFVRKYMFGQNRIYNASAVVFKKDVLNNIDSSLYNKYKAAGDRMFWALVCMQGDIAYEQNALNEFRQHKIKVSGSALHRGLTLEEDYYIYKTLLKFVQPSYFSSVIDLSTHRNLIVSYVDDKKKQKELGELWCNIPNYNNFTFLLYRIYCFNRNNIYRYHRLLNFFHTGKWDKSIC